MQQTRNVLAHGIAAGFTLGTIFCSCALVLAIVAIQSQRPRQNAG